MGLFTSEKVISNCERSSLASCSISFLVVMLPTTYFFSLLEVACCPYCDIGMFVLDFADVELEKKEDVEADEKKEERLLPLLNTPPPPPPPPPVLLVVTVG